jgi:hypothetical protein
MTAIGVAVGTPLGMLAGTYMAEYGRYTKLTMVVRFINDILLSAPSIVVGLFVYTILVHPMGHFSAISGAVALALLVVPVVVRTTEDMLLLVPGSMRRRPRWAPHVRMSSVGRLPRRKAGLITRRAARRGASQARLRRCFSRRSITSSGAPILPRRWQVCRSSSSSSRYRPTKTGSNSPGQARCSSPSLFLPYRSPRAR